MEKEEWKRFRNALDKSDRKKFDEMSEISRPYIMSYPMHVRADICKADT